MCHQVSVHRTGTVLAAHAMPLLQTSVYYPPPHFLRPVVSRDLGGTRLETSVLSVSGLFTDSREHPNVSERNS